MIIKSNHKAEEEKPPAKTLRREVSVSPLNNIYQVPAQSQPNLMRFSHKYGKKLRFKNTVPTRFQTIGGSKKPQS